MPHAQDRGRVSALELGCLMRKIGVGVGVRVGVPHAQDRGGVLALELGCLVRKGRTECFVRKIGAGCRR